MTTVMSFGEKDRLLSVLPLSHLYEQVLGFIAPLIVGASIVYPVSRQPAVLVRTFRDFKVTVLLIVPQGLRLLDSAIERRVDQAGKRTQFERLHRLAQRAPQTRPTAALPNRPRPVRRPAAHDRRRRLGPRHRRRAALDGYGRGCAPGLRSDRDGPSRELHPAASERAGNGGGADPRRGGPHRRGRRDPCPRAGSLLRVLAERRGHRSRDRRRRLVPHGRSRRSQGRRDADVPGPEEGHAGAARRAEGLCGGRRGDPEGGRSREGRRDRWLATGRRPQGPRRPVAR